MVERIGFGEARVGRRRGLEEVTVVLRAGGDTLTGHARVGRKGTVADAAAEATFEALGSRAPERRGVSVTEMKAGPVRVVRIEFRTADGTFEGSCSRAGRTLEEAVARCVLDALNPWWET